MAGGLCEAIRSGQLKPGDRLPTLRNLASELGVSLTTVTAAFKSLAESGWKRGEIGRCTFVAERGRYEAASAPPAVSVLTNPRRLPALTNPECWWSLRTLVVMNPST